MKKNKGRRKKSVAGRIYFALMVVFLVGVMVTQLMLLHNKSVVYAQREAALEEELQTQEDKRQELADYEQYTHSEEFTRDTAKSKLGLVFPNEIIFRER